jgi:hypothetical protein
MPGAGTDEERTVVTALLAEIDKGRKLIGTMQRDGTFTVTTRPAGPTFTGVANDDLATVARLRNGAVWTGLLDWPNGPPD